MTATRRPRPQRYDGRDYLTTAQTARRLGVKPETVYAYVSRGILASNRIEGVPGSLFAVDEVEALSNRAGAGRVASGAVERIRTQITLLDNDVLYYRGRRVTELADRPFECVAELLWGGTLPDSTTFVAPTATVAHAQAAVRALPAGARLTDRMRVIVDVAGACDRLRFDISAPSVIRAAGGLIATVAAALGDVVDPNSTVAERLWPALASTDATPDHVRLLNSALVLLADHDLAASTLAARMAASTRANVYSVVAAGLGGIDGPYHAGATSGAYRFLASAMADPLGALGLKLRDGERIPGFGHTIYQRRDPRAEYLLGRLRALPDAAPVLTAVDTVADELANRKGLFPNSDFALGALALSLGMTADAAEAIFAFARMAGWVAHALEEYNEKALRFRVPGVYTGRRGS